MSDLNRIKDRIRKLLNLAADDGAAAGEIENALRAAREMMLAHQLSDEDVSTPPEDLRTPAEIAAATEYGTARSWSEFARPPRWMASLAVTVAEFVGTVHVYHNHPERHVSHTGIVKHDGRPVKSWEFYGPADDVAFAVELHQELILTAAASAKLKWGGGLVKGEASDYCFGFANGLYDKVMAAKKQVEKAGYYGTDGIIHTGIGPFRMESGSYMAYGRVGYTRGALRINAFGYFLDAEAPNLLAFDPDTLGQVVLKFKTQTYDFEIGNTNVLSGKHILTYGGNVRATTSTSRSPRARSAPSTGPTASGSTS